MTGKTKRAVLLSLLLLAIAVAMILGRERLAGLAYEIAAAVAPDTVISWEEERAHVRCQRAADGKTSWPETDKYKCRALHMCAEAGELSESQLEKLRNSIAAIPYCKPL